MGVLGSLGVVIIPYHIMGSKIPCGTTGHVTQFIAVPQESADSLSNNFTVCFCFVPNKFPNSFFISLARSEFFSNENTLPHLSSYLGHYKGNITVRNVGSNHKNFTQCVRKCNHLLRISDCSNNILVPKTSLLFYLFLTHTANNAFLTHQ